MKRLAAAALMAIIAGCASRGPAPVVERVAPPAPPVVEAPPAPVPEAPVEKPVPTHTVKRGETLASIALQYGLDYRELAAWNNIVNPNRLEVGRVLVMAAPSGASPVAAAPVITPLVTAGPPIESRPLANTPMAKVEPRAAKVPFSDRVLAQMNGEAANSPLSADAPPPAVALAPSTAPPEPDKPTPGTDGEDVDWMWPTKGRVLAPFSEATKGMDIGGRKGAPVVAAASGRVVYAGGGLRGYGKLVIIKHNETWLSAYAHNDNILVKEQQDVRKGQKIAEMGSTDADQVKLHFEVRRQGKPVDPVKVLPGMQ
ncbi:MAG TPA: peptidoglycan DD-metalloendopeptidase family protein [Usitatibacter sp.]|nr:peptidoglycan DD-metalloendopeptidase family protein [Usitatibacter sp.]